MQTAAKKSSNTFAKHFNQDTFLKKKKRDVKEEAISTQRGCEYSFIIYYIVLSSVGDNAPVMLASANNIEAFFLFVCFLQLDSIQ